MNAEELFKYVCSQTGIGDKGGLLHTYKMTHYSAIVLSPVPLDDLTPITFVEQSPASNPSETELQTKWRTRAEEKEYASVKVSSRLKRLSALTDVQLLERSRRLMDLPNSHLEKIETSLVLLDRRLEKTPFKIPAQRGQCGTCLSEATRISTTDPEKGGDLWGCKSCGDTWVYPNAPVTR